MRRDSSPLLWILGINELLKELEDRGCRVIVGKVKYLGLILNRKLSWKTNIEERVRKASVVLYYRGGTTGGSFSIHISVRGMWAGRSRWERGTVSFATDGLKLRGKVGAKLFSRNSTSILASSQQTTAVAFKQRLLSIALDVLPLERCAITRIPEQQYWP